MGREESKNSAKVFSILQLVELGTVVTSLLEFVRPFVTKARDEDAPDSRCLGVDESSRSTLLHAGLPDNGSQPLWENWLQIEGMTFSSAQLRSLPIFTY